MSGGDGERLEITAAAELWDWLASRSERPNGVWLVTWKAARRDRYVSRDAVLDALIAFGWIDGRRKKLDDERTMQWIAPRQQQAWAQTYKDRAARLEAEGLMRAPGRRAMIAAQEAGAWDARADVDALQEPADLRAALEALDAAAWWNGAAPSYRRNVLRWLAAAKTPPTRAKRVDAITAHAARGEKVPQF